jgi:hypothetical protein
MRAIRPGVSQRSVEAVVENTCWSVGAHGSSFWPWAMAGDNAVFPRPFTSLARYDHLNQNMRSGDLVRLDVASSCLFSSRLRLPTVQLAISGPPHQPPRCLRRLERTRKKTGFDLKELTPKPFSSRFDTCNKTVNRFYDIRNRLVEAGDYCRLFLVGQVCISLKNGGGNSSQMRHSGEELQKDQCARRTKDRARVPSFPEENRPPT